MRKLTVISLAALAAVVTTATAGVVYAQVTPHGPSRTEVAEQAKRTFDRMDVNLDGQIDNADRETRQRARFDAADADGNGSLAFTEFAALRPGADGARPGEGMRGGKFRDRAEGGSGEGGRRHGMRGFGAGAGLLPMIGQADADADGAITQAEYSKAMLGRFDRADANKDSVVTREEMAAMRDAIRAQNQAARRTTTGQGS